MPTQDTSQIKEKIIFALKRRGPCLPVHIASEIQTSILFASAFLSELVSEKKIKMSTMKVGSSQIYFLKGQEHLLERFSRYLKSRERDAFELLKNKKFLKDSEQEPAIRVALRALKDFAIPFKQNEEIFWKYYLEKENLQKTNKIFIEERQRIKQEFSDKDNLTKNSKEVKDENNQKPLEIFEQKKPIKKTTIKKKTKKTNRKNTLSQKKNEKFFNKVKEFLSKKSISISDIIGFSNASLILKVIDNNTEKLLVAYNKKRILEADLLKAYKKSLEYNLPYIVLSLGELPKKLEILINAIEKLSKINKIE